MSEPARAHPFDQLQELARRCAEAGQALGADAGARVVETGLLAFRVCDRYFMAALGDVGEIVPVPPLTRVPGVRSWLLGIANLRGTILTVVDLNDFISDQPTVRTRSCGVLVVTGGGWRYGLLVDEVIGMRHPNQAAASVPGDLPAELRPYVSGSFTSDGREWLLFRFAGILDNERFLDAAL
ncbi:MAG: chemotaxis protein CheW [Candidatus Competibacterales bacterium]|nr:chemotaxis protein CheW [Candidatus Competibacterales bacterium]